MKKYVLMILMCCPLMAFGAPSVRALGSNAISGAAGAKVTPTKASVVSADRGSSMARVGSLRAKATTAAAPSATSSSTSRFPVILPTKVYNTANAPRPTGYSSSSTIINTDVDLTEIEQRIEENKNNIQTNTTNIATNTENISTNTTNISNNTTAINANTTNISSNTTRIEALEGRPDNADTILVSNGSGTPSEFNGRTPGENRAWIWVEQ